MAAKNDYVSHEKGRWRVLKMAATTSNPMSRGDVTSQLAAVLHPSVPQAREHPFICLPLNLMM